MDSNVSSWLWHAERVISQGTRKFVPGNVGVLIFEHAVELKLHDTARVGEIIGDDVEMVGSS